MESPGPSSTDKNLCQMCQSFPRKYTCPRCSQSYCSAKCYKSTSHLDCSEEFYKKCVNDELKNQSNDPEERKKMIEILKQFHAQSDHDVHNYNSDDESILSDEDVIDESIDSDDDNKIPDLIKRIDNVDLNNADDLWTVLTDAEKQEFEAIIRNGEEEKLLPQWTPWWSKTVKKKLVTVMNESEDTDYEKNSPNIIQITSISAIEKASPLMCYNLLNILSAYALMTLHYNGEHDTAAVEAVAFFLQLNDVIGDNTVFTDSSSAITSVFKKAIEYELIPDKSDEMMILDSVKQIIQGPCREHETYYTAAALSDLHTLFTTVKSKYCNLYKSNLNSVFPTKFKSDIASRYSRLTKKNLQLYIKKLEYYLAWNDKYGKRMQELNLHDVKQTSHIDL